MLTDRKLWAEKCAGQAGIFSPCLLRASAKRKIFYLHNFTGFV